MGNPGIAFYLICHEFSAEYHGLHMVLTSDFRHETKVIGLVYEWEQKEFSIMKSVAIAVVSAVVLGGIGFTSAASTGAVTSASQSATTAGEVARDLQAHQIKLDQDCGMHAASEVIESDAAAVSADKHRLSAMTGKD
jgi:hypothetical protein